MIGISALTKFIWVNMSMKIHFIVHESFESPGAFAKWALINNHTVTYTNLFSGDELPVNTDHFDFLIVMGGPQSPATTVFECPYFNAKKEIELIREAVKKKKYVVGVCLGAQLLGEAFGLAFQQSEYKEIGVYDVSLTDEIKHNPIFCDFPSVFPVGHWHSDMPGIKNSKNVLATSDGCSRQIICYSERSYGFQCHFEFTLETIENMIAHCGDELKDQKSSSFIMNADALRAQNYHSMNMLLFNFLDKFCSQSL